MSAVTPFPPVIRRFLSDHVARCRRVAVLRALVLAAVWVGTVALSGCLFDRIVHLPAWVRIGWLILTAGGAVWLVARPLAAWLRRDVDWVRAAEEIEARDRTLGQRLVTVVSQLLAPARYRGSEQMIGRLVDEVSGEVSESPRQHRRPAWGGVVRPAAVLIALAGLWAALWPVAWLNLPRLVTRQWQPLAGTQAVTTTTIEVTPDGAVDVKERESVTVRAVIKRLGDGTPPVLYSRQDDATGEWSRTPMIPAGPDAWTLTLSGLDRDVRFHVRAGDARSSQTTVRVLRRPALAEFRVRYAYPAYTGRAALSTHNTDGLIEAPHGTEAAVSVAATEPLASAVLVLKGENKRVELGPTADPAVRQGAITVSRDQPCELELVSERGVRGSGPAGMLMRSVPDRPPLVRMLQPATDLRLAPRDVLPVAYQALDDYGVAALTLFVQVNTGSPAEHALPLKADPRRAEDTYELDLARLSVKVGDVVTVWVRAQDKAGLKGQAEPRHVLVSPRSVDVATHQRLGELAGAYEWARDWADGLGKAQEYVDRARRASATEREGSAGTRASRALAAAQEAGGLLKQSLLRAVMVSGSGRMSDALVAMIDQLAGQSDYVDRVDQMLMAGGGADEQAVARLARATAGAKELVSQLKALVEGEQAAAVLADRANLRASAGVSATSPADKAAAERRRQMVDRARQDVALALEGLRINPKDKDNAIDQQLQARVDAARRAVDAAPRLIELVGPANKWAAVVRAGEMHPPRLEDRLYTASQAESVRPDAELVAARDVNLAARAAGTLGERAGAARSADAAGAKPTPLEAGLAKALEQFPQALAALRAEHEVNRRALSAKSAAEARQLLAGAKAVRAAATEARAKMVAWAAGADANRDEIAARAKELEELAMAANAAMASRQFDEAAALDKKLAGSANRPDVARATDAPRAIDAISQTQESVADQTAKSDDAAAKAIAGAQQRVAESLAGATAGAGIQSGGTVSDPDSRQRATAAITAAQERLAALPMQLSTAESMADAVADIAARLAKFKADAAAAGASPADREMAERMLAEASAEFEEATAALAAARKAVGTTVADELTDALRPFAPEATAATLAADDHLKPALADLQAALDAATRPGADLSGVESATRRARAAIQDLQDALRDAQARVIERDPLVSAKWFARAAADALAAAPPKKSAAAAHQRSTLEALGKAGQDAQRRSKNLRLSQVPGFSPLYLPPAAPAWGDGATARAGDRLMQTIPGLREWGRLRDRLNDPLTTPTRDTDPPGFSDALRVYFELLGKEDGGK